MSPVERYDPDTGMLVERRTHPVTPWASGLSMVIVGAIAYGFGAGGIAAVAGGSKHGAPPALSYSAPDAPTIEAVVVLAGDTAAYAQASAFSGYADDSLEYTVFEWDTVSGDFSAFRVDTVATPTLRDTVLTNPGKFKAGGVYKVRALQRGYAGGNSAYSVVDTFTATAVYFFTNWSAGAGTTPYYQADSASATPWPIIKGDPGTTARDGWVVVDTAAALGFPTGVSNVGIAKNMASGSPAVGVRSDSTGAGAGALDTMLVGESNFYGVFFKNVTPDSYISGDGDNETHPLQARASTTGTLPWEWMVLSHADGTWEFDFYLVAHTNYPGTGGTSRRFELATSRTNNIQLSKDTVYYFGWEVRRTHVDSVEYHVEVGVVINADSIDWRWDDNDFISLGTAWPAPFPNANSTTLADSPKWVYQDAPPGAYRGVNLGSNGWNVDPATDQDSYIFGAFCIRKDQHCRGYTGN